MSRNGASAELASPKFELFARLVVGGSSGAEAARLCGASRRRAAVTACEWLKRREVRERIQALREELYAEFPISRLIAQYQSLVDEARAADQREEAAGYLDRIARILIAPEGKASGLRRLEPDAQPTPIAELIMRLEERERAEREGRPVELRPALSAGAAE